MVYPQDVKNDTTVAVLFEYLQILSKLMTDSQHTMREPHLNLKVFRFLIPYIHKLRQLVVFCPSFRCPFNRSTYSCTFSQVHQALEKDQHQEVQHKLEAIICRNH